MIEPSCRILWHGVELVCGDLVSQVVKPEAGIFLCVLGDIQLDGVDASGEAIHFAVAF